MGALSPGGHLKKPDEMNVYLRQVRINAVTVHDDFEVFGFSTNPELDGSTRCRLWGIEETARLDESYVPTPLKHLVSCEMEGSR